MLPNLNTNTYSPLWPKKKKMNLCHLTVTKKDVFFTNYYEIIAYIFVFFRGQIDVEIGFNINKLIVD